MNVTEMDFTLKQSNCQSANPFSINTNQHYISLSAYTAQLNPATLKDVSPHYGLAAPRADGYQSRRHTG